MLSIYEESIPVERVDTFDENELLVTITENLSQNVLPFIERHSDCEFLFYFPPYSIVRWGIAENMEADLKAMEIIIEQLIEYENVSIIFYQGETDVITDLEHYMDTIHFDGEVANKVIDFMKNEDNKMTEENYKEILMSFSDFVRTYDYGSLLK